MNQTTGKYIILAGLILLIAGIGIYYFHDKLGWIGKLPGDIRIKTQNTQVYIPFTTMILFSVIINLFLYIIRKIS